MKKLLALLGTIGLVSSGISVVACKVEGNDTSEVTNSTSDESEQPQLNLLSAKLTDVDLGEMIVDSIHAPTNDEIILAVKDQNPDLASIAMADFAIFDSTLTSAIVIVNGYDKSVSVAFSLKIFNPLSAKLTTTDLGILVVANNISATSDEIILAVKDQNPDLASVAMADFTISSLTLTSATVAVKSYDGSIAVAFVLAMRAPESLESFTIVAPSLVADSSKTNQDLLEDRAILRAIDNEITPTEYTMGIDFTLSVSNPGAPQIPGPVEITIKGVEGSIILTDSVKFTVHLTMPLEVAIKAFDPSTIPSIPVHSEKTNQDLLEAYYFSINEEIAKVITVGTLGVDYIFTVPNPEELQIEGSLTIIISAVNESSLSGSMEFRINLVALQNPVFALHSLEFTPSPIIADSSKTNQDLLKDPSLNEAINKTINHAVAWVSGDPTAIVVKDVDYELSVANPEEFQAPGEVRIKISAMVAAPQKLSDRFDFTVTLTS